MALVGAGEVNSVLLLFFFFLSPESSDVEETVREEWVGGEVLLQVETPVVASWLVLCMAATLFFTEEDFLEG